MAVIAGFKSMKEQISRIIFNSGSHGITGVELRNALELRNIDKMYISSTFTQFKKEGHMEMVGLRDSVGERHKLYSSCEVWAVKPNVPIYQFFFPKNQSGMDNRKNMTPVRVNEYYFEYDDTLATLHTNGCKSDGKKRYNPNMDFTRSALIEIREDIDNLISIMPKVITEIPNAKDTRKPLMRLGISPLTDCIDPLRSKYVALSVL